jgi:hypothetical protein
VDAGADCPVPYSTTKDSNTTRLSGLPAEIEMEADSIKKGEGNRGQLPRHGWEEGLSECPRGKMTEDYPDKSSTKQNSN